jgi:hypothetical protein
LQKLKRLVAAQGPDLQSSGAMTGDTIIFTFFPGRKKSVFPE